MLRKVAVTGGLSCGKSSVCRILSELGAYIVSADKIVHQLLSSDKNLSQKVVELLGTEILTGEEIDRLKMSKLIFQDKNLLQSIEQLIHPAVYRKIDFEYQRQLNRSFPPPLFVAEVPMLFESGKEKDFDEVIVVTSKIDYCCQRFIGATGQDADAFYKRLACQLSLQEKEKRASFVIHNNGSMEELSDMTKKVYQELIAYKS